MHISFGSSASDAMCLETVSCWVTADSVVGFRGMEIAYHEILWCLGRGLCLILARSWISCRVQKAAPAVSNL
jgi:hypothetical protein